MGALIGFIFSDKKLKDDDINRILKPYKNGKSTRLNWDTYWCLGGPYWRADILRMKPEEFSSGNFRSYSWENGKNLDYLDEEDYIGVDSCRIKDLVMDPLDSLKAVNPGFTPWYVIDKKKKAFSEYHMPSKKVIKKYKDLMSKYKDTNSWITVVSIHW